MIWPTMLFNLCVGLLLAGYLLRGVRRFERRVDAIMAKLDERHAERMARLDRLHAEEMRKYDTARDEIRESMRSQVDAAIVEMQRTTRSYVDQTRAASRESLERAPAEPPPPAGHEPDERLPNPGPGASVGPVPTQPIEH